MAERLPIVRLPLLRSMFVDPLPADRTHVAVGVEPLAADPGPDANSEYKNGTDQGPVGIAGDGDTARTFTGANGYGYVNGIPAPPYQMTLEAWVNATDPTRDQSIAGHGDGGELYLEGGSFKFRFGPQNLVVSAGEVDAAPDGATSATIATSASAGTVVRFI